MTPPLAPSSRTRHAVFALVLAVSLAVALIYHVDATVRFAALRSRTDVPLMLIAQQKGGVRRTTPVDMRALAANPLDQQAVNTVIMARASASGDMVQARKDVGLLRQLGWRSSIALQSLLWRSAVANDQLLLMDTLDALLRREQLLAQIYPILNAMTQDPVFRTRLVRRLAANPSWRRYYFMSATELDQTPTIEGRYQVMREVQARGDRLTRNEVAPILPKLIQAGRTAQAFDLWQKHNGGAVTSPLADTSFIATALPLAGDALPVPFEWQLGSGAGYSVDPGRDGQGGFVSINWDGRGAPNLLSQATTALRGRYRLDVMADRPGLELVKHFGFRLACPNGEASNFEPRQAGQGRRAVLITPATVGCGFPTLEMFGLVQSDGPTAALMLRTVQLSRIG